MARLLGLIRAVPLRKRFFQVANGAAAAVLGRRMRVAHVVEHPKCGGSWVRNMVQQYLGGRPYLDDRLIGRRTVIQVHRLYSWRFCNPIIVVRDPRDMFVSFYYHETKYELRESTLAVNRYFHHDPERPVREDFAEYLEAKLTHRTQPAFRYAEFLDSWLDHSNEACLVRYEDCLDDCGRELRRIVKFLNEPVDEARIDEVVDYNSFANETKRRYGVARARGHSDASKFQRKGIAGDWRNHFNRRSCELIQRFEQRSLERLGYEKDASWSTAFLDQLADDQG